MSTRVPPTRCLQKCFKRLCPDDRPIIGSNPYHRSCGPLAAILPLFSCRLQFPIPLGLNFLLMPGEHFLRRDVGGWPTCPAKSGFGCRSFSSSERARPFLSLLSHSLLAG